MYEDHLKRMNTNSPSTTYEISQLSDFIDDLADLSRLVHQADTQTLQPYKEDQRDLRAPPQQAHQV